MTMTEEAKEKHNRDMVEKYYGYVTCKMCLYHRRKLSEKYRREQGVLPMDMRGDGYHCGVCGREVNKTKLCESCKQKLLKNLENATKASQNSTHWRITNRKFFIYKSDAD